MSRRDSENFHEPGGFVIKNAGQILVLDNGRLVEKGRHEELLAANGLYAHLWTEQHKAGGWKFESRKEKAITVEVPG